MDDKLTRVQGVTLPKHPNDSDGAIAIDSMGNIITCDWIQARINAGYGYNFANLTPDTLCTGATSYVATTPAIILVIPTGTVMVPFYLNIALEDSAGTDNHITVGCDTADLYTSGGIAGSALNSLRTTGGGTSAVSTAKNGDTAIVMVDPGAGERTLDDWVNAFADAVTEPPRVYIWEPERPPALIGPATFYAYIYGSTAPEYQYVVQWVEIPTANFTQ